MRGGQASPGGYETLLARMSMEGMSLCATGERRTSERQVDRASHSVCEVRRAKMSTGRAQYSRKSEKLVG